MSMLEHDARASMLDRFEHHARAYATYVRTHGLTQMYLRNVNSLTFRNARRGAERFPRFDADSLQLQAIPNALFGKIGSEIDDAGTRLQLARRLTTKTRSTQPKGPLMAASESTGAKVRCGGCPQTWTALGAAHCAACHVTFSTASNFDKHRAGKRIDKRTVVGTGTCTAPAELGMVLNKGGYWGMPADEDALSRLRSRSQSAETASAGVTGPEAA